MFTKTFTLLFETTTTTFTTKANNYLLQLECDQLEALLLEPLDDVTDEAPVDAVRFDHDEGPLLVGGCHLRDDDLVVFRLSKKFQTRLQQPIGDDKGSNNVMQLYLF